ncbi:MAG: FAD-binding oxidoreductase [Roseivirga sp.]|nr:FAD-binding oxidoreductase [Roseivirga sp.]
MEVDYIVVGQGIAGTVLTDHLMKEGFSVLVYDDQSYSNSSRVAGGLYNPITGRKMVKTWLADELFPYLLTYYKGLELRLSTRFLVDTPIYRPFVSIEEQNEWMGKSSDPAFQPFIRQVFGSSQFGEHIYDEFGGLQLDQSGYLNTKGMIVAFREYLLTKNALVEQSFDAESLELTEEGTRYKGVLASKVIFCDGPLLSSNKYFSWLPLSPVKGELLFIRVSEDFEAIYNRGVFIIPIGGGICKAGATYDHFNLDQKTTERARKQLIEKLDGLIKIPYEVVDQVAGIRPATKDRRPFVGIHPKYSQLGVFGGLGTKGVSLAPFFAKQFVEHLTKSEELKMEANIQRFFSLY